jgi:hypothetical protein
LQGFGDFFGDFFFLLFADAASEFYIHKWHDFLL